MQIAWRFLLLSFMLMTGSVQAQLTGVAKSIPSSVFGTWDLTMTGATSSSPFANDTTAQLTIAIDGSLCSDGLVIALPSEKTASPGSLFWTHPINNLEFSISTTAQFQGFNVASAAGTSYGFFTATRAASSESSCDKNQAFFDLAESNYPELFPEGVFILTHLTDTEFYRYYSATDTYLIIQNSQASARGGKFGSNPVALGNVATLVADGVDNLPIPVTATPTTFDDYYVGTYRLTLQNTATFSTMPSGTQLTFVITNDKRLCAGELVLDTPLLQSNSSVVQWQNTAGGYYYALKLLDDTTRDSSFQQRALDVYSSSGRLMGTFTGTRTSLSAECADATGNNPDLTTINLLFSLAEQKLPALFPGGPQTFNQKDNGSIFRYYAASGVTASVKNRQVFVKGGSFGSAVVGAGALDTVIGNLQGMSVPVQLPASLTGSYAAVFTAAGAYSPIASGTTLDLAITSEGNLCLDGTLYTNPELDVTNTQLVSWRNGRTGYRVGLNLAQATGSSVTLQLGTTAGDSIGSLVATKNLLLASCAGLVAGNIDLAKANQLFTLAEQSLPAAFPPSALTYNQLSGGSLQRFYPASGVLIAISGDTVTVSGGPYAAAGQVLGKLDTLLSTLAPKTLAKQQVSGQVVMTQGNLPSSTRKIDIVSASVAMPTKTATADLTSLVQQTLGNELKGTTSITISNVASTTASLSFDALIANTSQTAGISSVRNYTLRFVYTRL